eukprot:419122_1
MEEIIQFVWFMILYFRLILLSDEFETDIYNEFNMVALLVNVNANVNVNFKVKINMVIMIKEIKVKVNVKNVYLNIIIKMDNEINDIIININNIDKMEGYMMRIKWRINKLKITLNFLICMVVMVEEIKETKDK